jgi:hypothetical protein
MCHFIKKESQMYYKFWTPRFPPTLLFLFIVNRLLIISFVYPPLLIKTKAIFYRQL